MPEPTLSDKLLLLEEELARAKVPHAFGGAIALAYYATPRATIDLDINVFTRVDDAGAVLAILESLGASPLDPLERARLERDGQTRARWGVTPIDLFFSYDAFHDSCCERRKRVPFGEHDRIHILSAEDLVVFKVIFDRVKDWRDIEELVFAMGDGFDAAYAREWLGRILVADDARCQKLEAVLARYT